MIKDLFLTILPSLIILFMLYAFLKPINKLDSSSVAKAFLLGVLIVIPTIFSMRVVGILITIIIPYKLPVIFFRIISALTEELFKLYSIYRFKNRKKLTSYAIFIGGGFALCETLYLSFSNIDGAIFRALLTLPLHILTAILLSYSVKKDKKIFFLLSLLLHLSFNLIIR